MTEQINIADLREKLAAAASPLPWYQGAHYIGAGGEHHDPEVQVGSLSFLDDATLIVAAVNALPALLDEIERLRAERDDALREMHARELHHFEIEKLLTEAGIDPDDLPAALEAARQAGGEA